MTSSPPDYAAPSSSAVTAVAAEVSAQPANRWHLRSYLNPARRALGAANERRRCVLLRFKGVKPKQHP